MCFKKNIDKKFRIAILKVFFNCSCLNELKTNYDNKLISNSAASPRLNTSIEGIIALK
jgi:hypothetical protein